MDRHRFKVTAFRLSNEHKATFARVKQLLHCKTNDETLIKMMELTIAREEAKLATP